MHHSTESRATDSIKRSWIAFPFFSCYTRMSIHSKIFLCQYINLSYMSRPTVHAAHARRELAEKTAHQNLQPEQALNKTSERSISRCITQFIHKTFGAKKISRQWHKLVEKHRMKKKKPYHAEEKAKEKANERMTTFPFMQLPRELRDEVKPSLL